MEREYGVMEAFAPDACDDACSICLEPFSPQDPAMVTMCKHEYHLQCILEWSQRSRECPICSQALVLSDPASQELLAVIEVKSGGRTRRRSSDIPAFNDIPLESFVSHNVPSLPEDVDFDEHIVHNSRGRHLQSVARDHSQLLVFANPSSDTDLQHRYTTISNETHVPGGSRSLPDDASRIFTTPIIVHKPSLGSPPPSSAVIGSDVADNRRSPFNTRVLSSQALPGSPRTSRKSDILSFSESFKSKLATASSRYKESLSKSTRGFKDKLLARNNSVKELSKEVQREVTAGIAGVARLMERLDPTLKRNRGVSSTSCDNVGTSKLSHKDSSKEGLSIQTPDGCTGTPVSVTSSDLYNTAADHVCLSPDVIVVAHVQD